MNNKKYYAFFDVDGTLISIKTMHSFLKFFYMTQYGKRGYVNYKLYLYSNSILAKFGISREFLNRNYYKNYQGHSEKEIQQLGMEWFLTERRRLNNFYQQSVLCALRNHQAAGAGIVFVSGSFDACLIPIAEELGVKHILATQLEVVDGIYTGKILPPQTIGLGKSEAIQNFLKRNHFTEKERCFAYGDHVSDIPMLNIVGNPCVVTGDFKLEHHAKKSGWSVLSSNIN